MSGSILVSVLAFVVAIGVLVSVHEYGHFWVARRLGFKVLRFSVGFGKPLWKRIGRDPDRIEYVIAAVPLGGYVRLLDEREGPVPPGDEERAFNRRPPLARIAVLLAGPGANFLFAFIAFWALFLYGVPGLKPVVGEVQPGSHAAAAGLQSEDLLAAVDGRETPTRQAAVLAVLDGLVSEGRVALQVERGGARRDLVLAVPPEELRSLTEPGTLLRGLGLSFWYPRQPVRVAELLPGGPAERAGLQPGDEVVEIDGRPVADFRAFVYEIQGRAGEPVALVALREGERIGLTVTPEPEQMDGRSIGRVGLTVSGDLTFPEWMRAEERHGPLAALWPAARETWDKSALTVRFLWRMVTGDVSTKNISGPINIAQYAGLTATEGLNYYLGFLALVSISLAVLNLLPVPVLDGGQIAYQLAEIVKGKPLSMQAQLVGQKLGIAMLVALMGFAFYNDISRLLG